MSDHVIIQPEQGLFTFPSDAFGTNRVGIGFYKCNVPTYYIYKNVQRL